MSPPDRRFRAHVARKPISFTWAPRVTDCRDCGVLHGGFYLEKRREKGVVAEDVSEKSLPRPCRPETSIIYVGFLE
jgi:hypothetical protein